MSLYRFGSAREGNPGHEAVEHDPKSDGEWASESIRDYEASEAPTLIPIPASYLYRTVVAKPMADSI